MKRHLLILLAFCGFLGDARAAELDEYTKQKTIQQWKDDEIELIEDTRLLVYAEVCERVFPVAKYLGERFTYIVNRAINSLGVLPKDYVSLNDRLQKAREQGIEMANTPGMCARLDEHPEMLYRLRQAVNLSDGIPLGLKPEIRRPHP